MYEKIISINNNNIPSGSNHGFTAGQVCADGTLFWPFKKEWGNNF